MSSEKYLVGFSKEVDFRPMEFVDLHCTRSCCLCNVVPRVTFLLGCCHAFCELCYQNLLSGDRRCPMDEVHVEEDDVSKLTLSPKHLERQNIRCFNSKNGCCVVGTLEEVQSHFFKECTYYAVPCTKCKANMLRRDIVSHYRTSCKQEVTSTSSSTGAQMPIRGSSFDFAKETFASVGNIQEKLSTVEYQLNGYAVEIDSFKEMSIKNEQLLNRLLENQECVTADVGNRDSNMQQQGHDQGRASGNRSRFNELLSAIEMVLRNYSEAIDNANDGVITNVKAVNENVERMTERVGYLTDILQRFSEELTRAINADDEARKEKTRKKRERKAVLGSSKVMGDVAKQVYMLHAVYMQYTEAFFHFQDIGNITEVPDFPNTTKYTRHRASDVFVLCGYSVRLRVCFCVDSSHGVSVSVEFSLCAASTNSLVKWPFTIPFICRLVHTTDSTKDLVCDTVRPGTPLQSDYCKYCRPTGVENPAVRCEPIAYVEDLRRNGFILEDSLCIGVKLHPEMA